MIERQQPYARQLHVCINNRNGESKSCGYDGSEEVVEELRKVTKERNLKGKVRVVRSGCLDVCAFGPNMMIWPEGLWYMKVTKEDVPQIVDKYLSLASCRSGEVNRDARQIRARAFPIEAFYKHQMRLCRSAKTALVRQLGLNSSRARQFA